MQQGYAVSPLREEGEKATSVCAVCLEPLTNHSLSTDEIVAMMLEREQNPLKESGRLLLLQDDQRKEEEEEENDLPRGYSFVGNEAACREKHLLCAECVLEFAFDPTNLSCPCCRSPLAPLFTLLHAMQIEKARANFMCSQQQAIRDLVDEFVEHKLVELQQAEEEDEEEARGKRKRTRLQGEGHADFRKTCCASTIDVASSSSLWGNDFTEEIRYRTRAPDAREMLCMLRLKH